MRTLCNEGKGIHGLGHAGAYPMRSLAGILSVSNWPQLRLKPLCSLVRGQSAPDPKLRAFSRSGNLPQLWKV